MKILRFNESHTKKDYDFEDIFYPITDKGLSLSLEELYFHYSKDNHFRKYPNEAFRRPGYLISLKGEEVLDLSTTTDIVNEIEEIVSRLSETGNCIVKKIDFSPWGDFTEKVKIEFLLVDKSADEEQPNETEGFYEFIEKLRRAFTIAYNNKLTRSVEFEQGKDGVILKIKGETGEFGTKGQLVSKLKSFLREYFWNHTLFYHRYKYDVVLKDDKILINYNGREDTRNR